MITKQSKTTLDQCSFQHRRDGGHSIAKVLLVLAIVASVLVFAQTMYIVYGNESDIQTAITEIRMIQNAANEFKFSSKPEGHQYTNIGTNLSKLKPYLEQNRLSNGRNVFGGLIAIAATNTDRDLDVIYPDVHDIGICREILEYFGQVNKSGVTYVDAKGNVVSQKDELYIDFGETILGYIGGDTHVTGCQKTAHGNYELHIRID